MYLHRDLCLGAAWHKVDKLNCSAEMGFKMDGKASIEDLYVFKKLKAYILEFNRFRKKNSRALEEYMLKDNIMNLFVVSLFLVFSFIVRTICFGAGVVYANRGTDFLVIAVVYIVYFGAIKIELIEEERLIKLFCIGFWCVIDFVLLKYLDVEINKYGSISYFVIIMFIICVFLSGWLPMSGLMIIIDTIAACSMIRTGNTWNETKLVHISAVITLAVFSLVIIQYRYYTYIRDKRARIELKSVSEVDRLTNLLNRRGLDRKLEELWPMLRNMQREVWVIMIDIDHFKSYNDSYGHIAGDRCLKDVTECIYNSAAKHTELIVRYGGEEMVVVLSDYNKDKCVELAKDISNRIRGLKIKAGEKSPYPYLTVSIGISSMLASHDNTIYDIIAKADEQLYYSKNNGRNIITLNNNVVKEDSD